MEFVAGVIDSGIKEWYFVYSLHYYQYTKAKILLVISCIDICEDISDHVELIHALLETEISLKLLSYSVNILVDIHTVQLLWHQLRVSVLVLRERILQGLQDSNGNYTRQTDILQAFSEDRKETCLDSLTEVDDAGQLTIKCSQDYFSLDCGITAFELSDYSPSEDVPCGSEATMTSSSATRAKPKAFGHWNSADLEKSFPELVRSMGLLTVANDHSTSRHEEIETIDENQLSLTDHHMDKKGTTNSKLSPKSTNHPTLPQPRPAEYTQTQKGITKRSKPKAFSHTNIDDLEPKRHVQEAEILALKLENLTKMLSPSPTGEALQNIEDWELSEANSVTEADPLFHNGRKNKKYLPTTGTISPASSSDIASSLDDSITSGPLSNIQSDDESSIAETDVKHNIMPQFPHHWLTQTPKNALDSDPPKSTLVQQLQQDIQRKQNNSDVWEKIEGFVNKLDELIRWLFEAMETTENWTPPKADTSSLKLYLETHLSFKLNVDSHCALKDAVVEEGQQLMELIEWHKSVTFNLLVTHISKFA
ncbi:hypothetical protein scyTo_0005357 [Scyliorhinus torazame]|uniref:Uncharacterized protein n=1 Tax=Scyliorhinus torazame TaxID=75743 RepID=A0A401P6M8_SCYTO|nr:hypothetical protein [Scyliorhinus torazame]